MKSRTPLPLAPIVLFLGAVLWGPTGCSSSGDAVELNLARAKQAERAGKHAKARKYYDAVLNVASRNADALHGVGEDELRAGRLDAALESFRQSLESDADRPRTHYRVGYVLERQDETEDAREHYERAIKLDSRHAKAHIRLARLIDEENPRRAIDLYRTGLEIRPDDARAFYDLGNLLRARSRWDEAAEAFAESVRLEPEEPRASYRLGKARREQGDLEGAIEALRTAVGLEPDDVDFLYALASVLKDDERWAEAATLFTRVLTQAPDHEKSLYKLASSLEKDGRTEDAKAAYATAAERIRDDKALLSRATSKLRSLK